MTSQEKPVPSGIGGWLILPAIGLILRPLIGLAGLVLALTAAIQAVGGKVPPGVGGTYAAMLFAAAAGELIIVLIALLAGYLFFSRRSAAPQAFIAMLLADLVLSVIFSAWGLAVGLDTGEVIKWFNPPAFFVACAIWIPYFQRSRRVKATFARGATDQESRWLVFGSNVAVALVLGAVLTGVVIWLASVILRWPQVTRVVKTRSDWTTTGRFSLSPKTLAMLEKLPGEVRLTNLYSHTPEIPASEEQWQRVQDLLAQYEQASARKITVEAVNPALDTGAVETLVSRLRDRYKGELEKPKALVETFNKTNKDLGDLLAAEAKRLDAAADAWKNGPQDAVNAFRMVAHRWRQLQVMGDLTAKAIQALTDQALPAYSSAVTRGKDYFKTVSDNFSAVPPLFAQIQDLAKSAPLPAEVKAVLDSGESAYKDMLKRLADYDKEAEGLKELELDAVRRDISQGEVILIETSVPKAVIRVAKADKEKVRTAAAAAGAEQYVAESGDAFEVLAPAGRLDKVKEAIEKAGLTVLKTTTEMRPDKVKVVSFDDVWVRNTKARDAAEAQERLFAGESAVSSALLGLCATEKPAVLFVTCGAPASSWGGPYSEMADRIRKSNFIVEDWDLMRQPEMPRPEGSSMVILVLVPPSPPNPQMPMPPPTPEQFKPAIEAVKNGTPAVLLGEPANIMQPTVPYSELFDLFGVTAKFSAVAVRKVVVDGAGTEKAVPQVEVTAYEKHAISDPLGALPTMFLTASPLEVRKDLPAGTTAEVVASLPGGRDYWADTVVFEALRGEAKFDPSDDISGPLPLVVAASRKVDQRTQRVLLAGDADLAQDRVAFYRDVFGRELFPGNAELFINGLLWVTGTEEHLITVSPEALQARRIGELGIWALPLQILVIGGLPAVVLFAGVIVYLVRRG